MQKPCLIVLDVGHGTAAVLHDEGGTVVFDTGKGAHVLRHLNVTAVTRVEIMLLSHADADHIGGAATMLMNKNLQIEEVLLNPDSSKDSAVFRQLCFALAEANLRAGTRITPSLTTSTQIKRTGATIEVLHPPGVKALSGVGGKCVSGKRHTSNSMSAAIRVSQGPKSSVLLAGDIEFDCLDEWKKLPVPFTACVLVFPHHGGLPGASDEREAALFGFEITRMVCPDTVVFSNHRTKFGNPRDNVLSGIAKASPNARFVCTQLPERLRLSVVKEKRWSLHKSGDNEAMEGSIRLGFQPSGVDVSFDAAP